MTLRKFLIGATSVSLCMTWLPAGICTIIAAQQHSDHIWYLFASVHYVWFLLALLLAAASLVLCAVSFYRRDFAVGCFALVGSLAVLSVGWGRHFPIY
jgi:hypothetical protein